MYFSRLIAVVFICAVASGHVLRKRPFLDANCRGTYTTQFDELVHRLDRICWECAETFPSMKEIIRDGCYSDCYRNEIFNDCVKAAMIDRKDVDLSIMELSG